MCSVSSVLWVLKDLARTSPLPIRWAFVLLYEAGQFLAGGGIDRHAVFDGKPCLPHGFRGIFVSRHARVGRNCVIFQQVTIGSNTLADSNSMGAPVIGDHGYFGAGAKIIGGIRLGDHVRVGANAVVHQSVPDHSVVTAGSPDAVRREHLDNRFFTRRNHTWVYYDDGRWIEEQDPAVLERLNGAMP